MKRVLLGIIICITSFSLTAQQIERVAGIEQEIPFEKQKGSDVVGILQKLLAEEFELYKKTWTFHWNIEGMFFTSLHKFFGKLYAQQQADIDLLAERLRALDEYASVSFVASPRTQIQGLKKLTMPDQAMIEELLRDYESVLDLLRKGIGSAQLVHDEATVNLLSTMIERTEKSAWMLRAHLGK